MCRGVNQSNNHMHIEIISYSNFNVFESQHWNMINENGNDNYNDEYDEMDCDEQYMIISKNLCKLYILLVSIICILIISSLVGYDDIISNIILDICLYGIIRYLLVNNFHPEFII